VAIGWSTQKHNKEPYISRSSTIKKRKLNHLWKVFSEKADFSKLNILILTILSYR